MIESLSRYQCMQSLTKHFDKNIKFEVSEVISVVFPILTFNKP